MVMSRDSGLNSERFYFSPDFVSNFRKIYQIWGKLAQEHKSCRKKQIGGGKHCPPQVLIGLKNAKVSKSKFTHTPLETKNIFVLEQKAILF